MQQIKHFLIDNFLEKNKDTLHKDITDLLQASSNSTMNILFPFIEEEMGIGRGRSRVNTFTNKSSKKSLSSQFTTQLNSLIQNLDSMEKYLILMGNKSKKKF
eukprot:TRINITY_DN6462_c0_g1_i1.p1 TRINITY_DN6462_c0_g1~~TRINITY_DN6462_c0_g1_i1.p1  ORF type:complete len:102 (+),score=18.46 TRINITY_DN6462_c0_g1_i1:207-512(+)